MVLADGLRALAFVGIALSGDFAVMLALALLAGTGTTLFGPAVQAALPGIVESDRRAPATALYGALDDLGYTLGPALAAGMLLFAGAEAVMLLNGVSFALSALVLARLQLDRSEPDGVSEPAGSSRSLLQDAGEGMRAAATIPGIRTLLLASSGLILCAGVFNVGELLLARDELGAGATGYALLAASFGLGIVGGSLAGARGGEVDELRRRYLAGLALAAGGFLACGLAPTFSVALVAFGVGGIGNGLVIVHERLLIQALVPERLLGRVFGVKDSLLCWAFAPGFVFAGALTSLLGTRTVLVIAGGAALVVWGVAAHALGRSASDRSQTPAPARALPALARS